LWFGHSPSRTIKTALDEEVVGNMKRSVKKPAAFEKKPAGFKKKAAGFEIKHGGL